MKPTHNTKTYACRILYESSSCIENDFTFTLNIYDQCSDFDVNDSFITMIKYQNCFMTLRARTFYTLYMFTD